MGIRFKLLTLLGFALSALAWPILSSRPLEVRADDSNEVWLQTASVQAGQTGRSYCYLGTHEELSSLSMEVHFDPNLFSVNSTYNNASAQIYDSSIHEDYVSYTYIFDSVDTENDIRLFYFKFTVSAETTPGQYYFDVIVNDAYNSSLEEVNITSLRQYFTVQAKPEEVSGQLYANKSKVSSSFGQEFSLSYQISRNDVASGSVTVAYDDTMFEVVSLTKGGYLNYSIFDTNIETKGQAYVSFISQGNRSGNILFSITFRQKKNETSSSEIIASVGDLYTDNLQPVTVSSSPKCRVRTTYDPAFDVKPKMIANSSLNTANSQIDVMVSLEKDSHIGAGDFVLSFDKTLLTYAGYEQKCSPTFFTVNDKEKQLSQGQVKFSILSMTDMVETCDIMLLHFAYGTLTAPAQASFSLSGSGVTDALTNPVSLEFQGSDIDLPYVDPILYWGDQYLFMNDPSFIGDGQGRCVSENLYTNAKNALLALDEALVAAFSSGENEDYAAVLARYLAWANANHDEHPFVDDSSYLHPSFPLVGPQETLSWQMVTMMLVLGGTSLAVVALVIANRRKKTR